MEKKLDIGNKAKVSIVWNVKPSDYTKEKEKNIISLFAKKYEIPESNVTVECNYITNDAVGEHSLNAENIKNIDDPKFQQELYKQYLQENNIECDFDEIVKIDSQINSLIDFTSYEKSKRYTIKWIKWSNFLSYGKDNFFDFTKLRGLVLLNGEPANKSGKSTFAYDLLHFLLFGETKSGKAKTLGELFNNYLPNETELFVEGCITIDGCDYIIKRTLTRAAKSKKTVRTATQKVEYYRLLPDGNREALSENLQEASSKVTSQTIKEAIGNESDFDLIISANMKDLDELISLKEDARGKLLSRWIGLSCLEDKDIKAREVWNKQIKVGRYCDLYNRETLKTEIDNLNGDIETYKAEIEIRDKRIDETTKNITNYTADKERYLSDKKPIDTSLLDAGDMTTLETKEKELIKNGLEKKNLFEAKTAELAGIPEIVVSEERYKQLQTEKEGIISSISTLRTEINGLKTTNKNLALAEYCPTCKRKYDNVDNSQLISENEKLIETKTNEGISLSKRKDEITAEMVSIENDRNTMKMRNSLELYIATLSSQLKDMRSSLIEVRDKIKKRKENEEAIRYNDELDAKINVVSANIRTQENVRTASLNEKTRLESGIATMSESIKEKEGIIARIAIEEKEEILWGIYLKMVGKDGISKMILRNSLPIINAELNRLLNNVADFNVEVSINDKNDVDFWLVRDYIKSRLSAASGLERTQAALALRVVLGNMSRLSKPPFILLDEVLGGVAKENYDDMKKLYDKIAQNYDFILHICHIDLDWHDMVVTVVKDGNISTIKSLNY